ncbi:hypothetical protein QFZ89_005271 [Paraburkholderia youngii]
MEVDGVEFTYAKLHDGAQDRSFLPGFIRIIFLYANWCSDNLHN